MVRLYVKEIDIMKNDDKHMVDGSQYFVSLRMSIAPVTSVAKSPLFPGIGLL